MGKTTGGLTHDEIIAAGFDENNLPSGVWRTDGGGGGGGGNSGGGGKKTTGGLTHDEIIAAGFDENNLPSGVWRTDGGGGGGGGTTQTTTSNGQPTGPLTHDQIIAAGYDINNLPAGVTRSDIGTPGTPASTSASTIKPFAWTNQQWTDARATAIAPGSPLYQYYTQKLSQANGDVNLAKTYIEEDYQRGLRYQTGNYNAENTYNTQKYISDTAANTAQSQQERYQAAGEAGAKGYYAGEIPQGENTSQAPQSDYYNKFVGQPLSIQQQSRKQAIDLAYNRQSQLLGLGRQQQLGTDFNGQSMMDQNNQPIEGQVAEAKSKDTTNLESGLANTQMELNKQKSADINTEAQNQYSQAQSNYNAVNNSAKV